MLDKKRAFRFDIKIKFEFSIRAKIIEQKTQIGWNHKIWRSDEVETKDFVKQWTEPKSDQQKIK